LTALSLNTRSIVALNAVSALAQIGQFGLGTTLIPIAMEARKASAQSIGFTSGIFWLGMLLGLLFAGKLTRQLGYRNTVILGLIVSASSFLIMPMLHWHWWALPAAVIGFGMGLRWIANETWLYRLAPIEARGRVVGIHETFIAIASVVAPLIVAALGVARPSAFYLASAIMLLALLPLFIATQLAVNDNAETELTTPLIASNTLTFWLGLGGIIAGLGGWVEGSLLALLPVYNADLGLSSQDSAWLFTLFGIGTFVWQYPIGWLADKKGVIESAKLCALAGFMAILLILMAAKNVTVLASCIVMLGGVTAGLLTLGMIWATQHNHGAAIANRMRQASITYTLLSAVGPFVAGFVVSHTSSQSLFWLQLMVVFGLFAVLFKAKASD
jgi:MFS family permease